jgi:hypothetical protein
MVRPSLRDTVRAQARPMPLGPPIGALIVIAVTMVALVVFWLIAQR